MSRRTRYALAVAALILALIVCAGIFFCWLVAIWEPWGNAEEWGTTGAAGLFLAAVLGFTSLALFDPGGKR